VLFEDLLVRPQLYHWYQWAEPTPRKHAEALPRRTSNRASGCLLGPADATGCSRAAARPSSDLWGTSLHSTAIT
jgi:hypothetical protein